MNFIDEILKTLKEAASATIPSTPLGTQALSLGAGAGCLLSLAVGGFDKPFMALFILMLVDYATGVASALKNKECTSYAHSKGIAHKVWIWLIVMLATAVDYSIKNTLVRDTVISGYALNEALSILENIGRLGCAQHIPAFLKARLAQLKDKKTKENTETNEQTNSD